MRKHYKICTFKFQNQTTIVVAVPDDDLDKTFEKWLAHAKTIGWRNDETILRGPVTSFEVGDPIIV
jgi:hypothetical protein